MTNDYQPPASDALSSELSSGFSLLAFDPEDYDEFFEGDKIDEDQKQELLEILWRIVITFVDMGFGLEATQQALASLLEADFQENDDKTDGGAME